MMEALNMLYRLFAPLLVVIVIIAGVDLSSELIKNTQEKQTAISIAHAATCPVGGLVAAPPCPPPVPGKPYVPTYCGAASGAAVQPGVCTPMGPIACCFALASPTAKSILQKSSFGSTITGTLNSLMGGFTKALPIFLLQKMMQPDNDNPPQVQSDYDTPPQCKSASVSPTLPLRSGESAVLSWRLGGDKAESVIVSPGVGLVQGPSVRVSPDVSTTYTVTARNRSGSTECPKVRVYVGPREVGDDDVFNTSGGAYDDDLNIWSDNTNNNTNSNEQGEPQSIYDDIGQPSIGDDEYYDFSNLSDTTIGSQINEDNTAPIVDTRDYYYGSQEPAVEETFDDFDYDYGEDVGDYYYDNAQTYTDANSTSGLTEQEIYGIWSRPQSPVTGGLGITGGAVTGDLPEVDLSANDEDISMAARIGRWFKSVFCFWCDGPVSWLQGGGAQQLAASLIPSITKIVKSTTPYTKFSYSKKLECKDKQGKIVKDRLDISLAVLAKDLKTEDSGRHGFLTDIKLRGGSTKLGLGKCIKYPDATYSVDIKYVTYKPNGEVRSTSIDKQVQCKTPKVIIFDITVDKNYKKWLKNNRYFVLPITGELESREGEEIPITKQFAIVCGDIKSGDSISKSMANLAAKSGTSTSSQIPLSKKAAEVRCALSGGTLKLTNKVARCTLKPSYKNKKKSRLDKGARLFSGSAAAPAPTPTKVRKPKSNSMWEKMFWTKLMQNMNKPKQQASTAPRPRPTEPQKMLPRCQSFIADKTNIQAGDEITLTWIVQNASRVVISPRVRVVDEDGKKVAKANPESSVIYTMTVYNTVGDEYLCQTTRIIVDGEGSTTGNSCNGKIGTVDLDINPNSVTRPLCDSAIGSEACNNEWKGKDVTIGWELSCIDSCVLTGPDGIRKSGITKSDSLMGKLRKTSTFNLKCSDSVGNRVEDSATATVMQTK